MRAFSIILSLVLASALSAQEPVVKSKLVGASLFKNGLAVIQREVVLPGPGTFRLDDLPEPVHGTWWVESATPVETIVKMRKVEVPAGTNFTTGTNFQFQENLAGRKVTIYFKDGKPDPVNGTVLKFAKPKDEADEPSEKLAPGDYMGFLVLKTARGRMFIDRSQIGIVEVEGSDELTQKVWKPLLLVSAPKANADAKLRISYLTHGLGWASSYRVDISDPKKLEIELAALVKNELAGFENAELRLISGFPSVQFAHVRSPLVPQQSWESFFQQLQSGPGRSHAILSQAVANVSYNDRTPFGINAGANAMGEGVDLHYQPIGKRSLAKGETQSLSIAKDKAEYERIVEWLIRDNRDEHGRYRRDEPDDEDDAWDALRFKNPFSFPMTTGPAMITANGRFNGQRLSRYVSAGEETMLRITKALSVRTRHAEQEVIDKNGERPFIYVGGHRYMKSTIEAELTVANHRKEDIKVAIRRRFSGDLLTADGAPKSFLREEGAYSVNKRNEMVWVLPLKGGEERRLTYRYTILVAH